MSNPEYVDQVLRIFSENLPLAEMEGEPRDEVGFGENFEKYNKLNFIMQELRDKPLKGKEFVIAGLRSPAVMNRNGALTVLKKWVELTGEPLQKLSPELYEEMKALKTKEVSKGPMEIINILMGEKTAS